MEVGGGGGGRERDIIYLSYTVTTRMIPVLRLAATRAGPFQCFSRK